LGRPLIDGCFNACAIERHGRRNAANAATNNTNIQIFRTADFRGFVIKKLFPLGLASRPSNRAELLGCA
jgi:hypothetical protein